MTTMLRTIAFELIDSDEMMASESYGDPHREEIGGEALDRVEEGEESCGENGKTGAGRICSMQKEQLEEGKRRTAKEWRVEGITSSRRTRVSQGAFRSGRVI